MAEREDIKARFGRDTAGHAMTVLHDAGLYRHVRFAKPGSSIYWFDLITVPGALIFQGDGGSFVFRRTDDMFAFFRASAYRGEINPGYWAEKLTDGGECRVRVYDEELLREHINSAMPEEGNPGLTAAVQKEILDELTGIESLDCQLVRDFAYWADPSDFPTWSLGQPDFQFEDYSQWRIRDYHWWYLWACHAIVWGISQYDAQRATAVSGESDV